jgi:hypothetical protein
MKNRSMGLAVISSLVLLLVFLPQYAAQARKCYDSTTKQEIPCPKSDQVLTQEARKNIPPSYTPVPATDTPLPTATNTPTSTLTSTPSPTNTPTPTATQAAAQLIVPVKVPAQPNACDPRIWQATAGFGVLLALTGVAAQAIRARSATRAIAQGIAVTGYGAESRANAENLDVHIGRVDFADGGDQNPNPTGPIALTTTGIVLALGSGASLLNLIPCTGWMAVAGGSLVAGLAAGLITLVRRKGGMRPFFSGKIEVTGNEKLARKIKDDFDEQK